MLAMKYIVLQDTCLKYAWIHFSLGSCNHQNNLPNPSVGLEHVYRDIFFLSSAQAIGTNGIWDYSCAETLLFFFLPSVLFLLLLIHQSAMFVDIVIFILFVFQYFLFLLGSLLGFMLCLYQPMKALFIPSFSLPPFPAFGSSLHHHLPWQSVHLCISRWSYCIHCILSKQHNLKIHVSMYKGLEWTNLIIKMWLFWGGKMKQQDLFECLILFFFNFFEILSLFQMNIPKPAISKKTQ